jgi:hypothetical protein
VQEFACQPWYAPHASRAALFLFLATSKHEFFAWGGGRRKKTCFFFFLIEQTVFWQLQEPSQDSTRYHDMVRCTPFKNTIFFKFFGDRVHL